MIKSKELTDPNSCMSRARDDEMTFVLLGRDKASAAAILCWCFARVMLGKNRMDDAQIVEALAAADAMQSESGAQISADDVLLQVAVQELSDRAFHNSHKKGFWDGVVLPEMTLDGVPPVVGDTDVAAMLKGAKIDLMHSELGEMTEGIRKPGPDSHCPEFTSEEIELADVFIRGGDYASARGLRLGAAIVAKMAFNATRPRKHGKAS